MWIIHIGDLRDSWKNLQIMWSMDVSDIVVWVLAYALSWSITSIVSNQRLKEKKILRGINKVVCYLNSSRMFNSNEYFKKSFENNDKWILVNGKFSNNIWYTVDTIVIAEFRRLYGKSLEYFILGKNLWTQRQILG